MTREEIEKALQDIGVSEDAAERRSLLANVTTNLGTFFDNQSALEEQNKTLAANNKKLQEYNMELYLQVGQKKDPEDNIEDEEEEDKKLSYDDLFDEKGALK